MEDFPKHNRHTLENLCNNVWDSRHQYCELVLLADKCLVCEHSPKLKAKKKFFSTEKSQNNTKNQQNLYLIWVFVDINDGTSPTQRITATHVY